MTAQTANSDDKSNKSPCRDFRSALPVSDGVVMIRAMLVADAEAYAAGTDDALVKRFAHLPLDKYTQEIVSGLIEGAIADGLRDGTLAVLAISDAKSDAFLGSLVLFDITPDEAEIGYWVSPEHRGRKISGRALILALEVARNLGFKKLQARTVEDNPASQRVLRSAGFEKMGEARLQIVPSGKTRMSVKFVIDL